MLENTQGESQAGVSKKILITGGAGFIGSNLCEYFVGKGY
ncbi:MAG: NAD-dependent epimerase/dehydratase family protein, partial [Flavobacterium sp.]